jgi:altronate dehydratase large subunit
MRELTGYKGAGGRPGIRKHVVVLSLNSFCNTATELIAHAVRGTIALVHPHGRNEIGIYRERLERSLLGIALHPNVHSLLLVGYEPKSTMEFVETVRKTSAKPVESVLVLEGGTWNAVRTGTEKALDMVVAASEAGRGPIGFGDLIVGVKCGGSDATSGIASNAAVGEAVDRIIEAGGTAIFSETTEILGAEHILARRAVNEEVAKKIYRAVEENERMAMAAGIDLLGVNPVPDNIRGGISTIEEKSLGAILKAGSSPIQDVLGYAEVPARPGLYFMDSPSAATEVLTGLSAAGAQIILFSTGTGNPVGNPISPVLKITSNPRTVARMKEHIDVDVSGVLTGSMSMREGGDRILRAIVSVINGRLTKAEVVGHVEFAPIPVGL